MINWKNPPYLKESSAYPWILLFNITWVTFIAVFSATSIMVASVEIQGALGINSTYAQWTSIAFLLAMTAAVPLSSRTADQIGSKRLFFLGTAVLCAGSLFTALSETYIPVVLGRLISGFGAGLIFPISLALIAMNTPKERLSMAVSIYTAGGFGLSVALGLSAGGWIVDHFNWPLLYYLTAGICAPSLLVVWLVHKESEPKETPSFDLWGYLTFCLFLSLAIILVTNVKAPWNTAGWRSPFALCCIGSALLSLIAFILFELSHPNPLFALRFFKLRPFAIASFSMVFVGGLVFGTQMNVASMLEQNFLYSKTMAGLVTASYGLAVGLATCASGFLNKWVHNRYITVIGLSVLAISAFMNHGITHMSSKEMIIHLLLIRGIGIGFTLGPITSLGLAQLPPQSIGVGAMMLTVMRQAGGSIGGSLVALIQAERINFHKEVFGSAMNIYSPQVQQFLRNWKWHLMSNGQTAEQAHITARDYLIYNGANQAAILSLNDGYFIYGILILIALLLVTLMIARVLIKQVFNKTPTK